MSDCCCRPNPVPTPELLPTQMVFTEVFREAWLDPNVLGQQDARLQPPALQSIDDQFTDPTTGRFTLITEATNCTIGIAAGALTLTAPAGVARMSLLTEPAAGSLAMPQQFTSVQVTQQTGTFGAYCAVLLGFAKDGNNYVVANWNLAANAIQIQSKIGGVNHFDASVSTAAWGAFPTTIAISVVGTWLTVYAKLIGAPELWIKVTSFDLSVYIDFKAENLALWFSAFGLAAPGTFVNTVTYKHFTAGRFGGVGMRDFCVVTHEDGSPKFASPTSVYGLATLAGASGGILEASMGVFVVDLEKKTFDQVGLIMVSRGGKIQNDHAGCMIRQDNGDQHLCVSTWGTDPTPTRIVYAFVPAVTDLLVGSHAVACAVLPLTQLPTAGAGQYDPFLILQAGLFYMAYTVSVAAPTVGNPFYPALDSSPTLAVWTNIGSDPVAARYEGTRILPFNGTSHVLTGGQFNMRMYTLGMVYEGLVNVISPGDGTTQPHPMIFPYGNIEVLITFDQTRWPVGTGLAFSWGSIHWFASPRF